MKSLHAMARLAALMLAAAPAAHAQALAGAHRPAAVPANFLITPFGYFHPTCVVHLAQGDTLLRDQQLIRHTDGSTAAMHACAYPHFRADGESVVGDERNVRHPDIGHAWIEYASVTTKSSYGSLSAQWVVPPTPPANDGQTVFMFPGMEDINDVVTIIQPVLGWNSDYKSAWGIASWNCCEQGTTYEAPPARTTPGDTIYGVMTDDCKAGTKTCPTWDITTKDLRTGKSSTLSGTSNFGQTFNWAFAGALEVYNITQCTDFPTASGYPGGSGEAFNQLTLTNDSFKQIASPAWTVSNDGSGLSPQCNYGGSAPTQVILTY